MPTYEYSFQTINHAIAQEILLHQRNITGADRYKEENTIRELPYLVQKLSEYGAEGWKVIEIKRKETTGVPGPEYTVLFERING